MVVESSVETGSVYSRGKEGARRWQRSSPEAMKLAEGGEGKGGACQWQRSSPEAVKRAKGGGEARHENEVNPGCPGYLC